MMECCAALYSKRPQDSDLKTPRKKRKRNTASDQAFLVDDFSYTPPSSSLNIAYFYKNRPRISRKPIPRKVPRAAKRNLRDPFRALNDDEAYQIINLLDARDTENLRRVSKLWKASSELHCGRKALLKHFPWAASKVDKFKTQEEINLQFRRYLYHQESWFAGYATRAIMCTKVQEWHIGSSSLVWIGSHKEDVTLSIGALKSSNGISTSSFERIDMSANKLISHQVRINYVQMTPDGELLLQITALEKCPILSKKFPGYSSQVEKIVKMSSDKLVIWELKLKATINRPAIGKDAIFFVRAAEETPLTIHNKPLPSTTIALLPAISDEPFFYKVSLKDGSIIFSVPLPKPSGAKISIPSHNTSMALTSDESLAIWNDLESKAYIFSSVTGAVIHIFDRSSQRLSIICTVDSKLWDLLYCERFQYHRLPVTTAITFDKDKATFTEKRVFLPRTNGLKSWSFDGDRPLYCYFRRSEVMSSYPPSGMPPHNQNTTFDPFMTIAIYDGRKSAIDDMDHRADDVNITLPPYRGKGPERRLLELELPQEVQDGDFFGMCEDYLVYHNRCDEWLLLVDFWPTW